MMVAMQQNRVTACHPPSKPTKWMGWSSKREISLNEGFEEERSKWRENRH
jgi:hypothetical protein